MRFKWKKKGIILENAPNLPWSNAYYQFAAVLKIEDKLRIFYTTRPLPDKEGRYTTFIRYADVDVNDFTKVICYSEEPVIPLGLVGEFDQFGTMPGDFVELNDQVLMFYTGWNRLQAVPYSFSVGLAVSENGGKNFKKYSKGPVMGVSSEDPFTLGSGAVIKKNNELHMFYISGIKWIEINDHLEHTYAIKHAVSSDGIQWKTLNGYAIDQKNEFEAIAAPTVIEFGGIYHMWFSYRGSYDFRDGNDSYEMGYAYSKDLIKWIRNDDLAGIQKSNYGWDSKMICYPYVFKLNEKLVMLYNGNSFGKIALGYAVCEL